MSERLLHNGLTRLRAAVNAVAPAALVGLERSLHDGRHRVVYATTVECGALSGTLDEIRSAVRNVATGTGQSWELSVVGPCSAGGDSLWIATTRPEPLSDAELERLGLTGEAESDLVSVEPLDAKLRRLEQLETLAALFATVRQFDDDEALIGQLLALAAEASSCETVAIGLFDDSATQLARYSRSGHEYHGERSTAAPWTAEMARTCDWQSIIDVMLRVPLRAGTSTVGVLELSAGRTGLLTEGNLDVALGRAQ